MSSKKAPNKDSFDEEVKAIQELVENDNSAIRNERETQFKLILSMVDLARINKAKKNRNDIVEKYKNKVKEDGGEYKAPSTINKVTHAIVHICMKKSKRSKTTKHTYASIIDAVLMIGMKKRTLKDLLGNVGIVLFEKVVDLLVKNKLSNTDVLKYLRKNNTFIKDLIPILRLTLKLQVSASDVTDLINLAKSELEFLEKGLDHACKNGITKDKIVELLRETESESGSIETWKQKITKSTKEASSGTSKSDSTDIDINEMKKLLFDAKGSCVEINPKNASKLDVKGDDYTLVLVQNNESGGVTVFGEYAPDDEVLRDAITSVAQSIKDDEEQSGHSVNAVSNPVNIDSDEEELVHAA